jgi:biotin transport system substrate-specific component
MGAPFAAAAAGLIYRSGKRSFLFAIAGAAVGDIIILAIGAIWLGMLANIGFSNLLNESVVPFLATDAAKVIAAAACAQVFASFSKRASRTA